MKPVKEVTIELPPEHGWKRYRVARLFEADWETGAAYFKSLGYRNFLTSPATIIPTTFNCEKQMSFHPNAVVMTLFAEAHTCNQPKGWTGEVQIPPQHRRNEWHEEIELAVYIP